MKKIIKILIVLIICISIFILSANFLIKKFVKKENLEKIISKKTGANVRIESIGYSFPFNISIKNISVSYNNKQMQAEAFVPQLKISLNILKIIKKKIEITNISLNGRGEINILEKDESAPVLGSIAAADKAKKSFFEVDINNINIKNFNLKLIQNNIVYVINNINASAHKKNNLLDFRINSDAFLFGQSKLKANGTIEKNYKNLNLNFSIDGLSVKKILKTFSINSSNIIDNTLALNGNISFSNNVLDCLINTAIFLPQKDSYNLTISGKSDNVLDKILINLELSKKFKENFSIVKGSGYYSPLSKNGNLDFNINDLNLLESKYFIKIKENRILEKIKNIICYGNGKINIINNHLIFDLSSTISSSLKNNINQTINFFIQYSSMQNLFNFRMINSSEFNITPLISLFNLNPFPDYKFSGQISKTSILGQYSSINNKLSLKLNTGYNLGLNIKNKLTKSIKGSSIINISNNIINIEKSDNTINNAIYKIRGKILPDKKALLNIYVSEESLSTTISDAEIILNEKIAESLPFTINGDYNSNIKVSYKNLNDFEINGNIVSDSIYINNEKYKKLDSLLFIDKNYFKLNNGKLVTLNNGRINFNLELNYKADPKLIKIKSNGQKIQARDLTSFYKNINNYAQLNGSIKKFNIDINTNTEDLSSLNGNVSLLSDNLQLASNPFIGKVINTVNTIYSALSRKDSLSKKNLTNLAIHLLDKNSSNALIEQKKIYNINLLSGDFIINNGILKTRNSLLLNTDDLNLNLNGELITLTSLLNAKANLKITDNIVNKIPSKTLKKILSNDIPLKIAGNFLQPDINYSAFLNSAIKSIVTNKLFDKSNTESESPKDNISTEPATKKEKVKDEIINNILGDLFKKK